MCHLSKSDKVEFLILLFSENPLSFLKLKKEVSEVSVKKKRLEWLIRSFARLSKYFRDCWIE